MNFKTLFRGVTVAVGISLATPSLVHAKDPIPVVATFSILGDLVKQIGGKHISLTTLVGPDGDAHVYKPTPADARAVSGAKVLFLNGLEFEGWINRLVDASDFKGLRVVSTKGIEAIPFGEDGHDDHKDAKHAKHDDHKDHGHAKHDDHKDDKHDNHKDRGHAKHDDHKDDKHDDHKDHGHAKHDDHKDDKHAKHDDHAGHDHGAFDPHAWQSAENIVIYLDNITAALAKADPSNASNFFKNRGAYVAKVKALDAEISAKMKALPEAARTVITSHDAFGYFAKRYGLNFEAPQGMSAESEASAKDVAKLITQIRKEKIRAVFVETITDNRLMEQIVRETGAKIGGTLYSDALSGPQGPAASYLDMMRHNSSTILGALAGS